ncbi:PPR10 [Symbiodinium sp. CCMP2456]|nr:PPR10 [Symbiodinium sp. CCMP2456]
MEATNVSASHSVQATQEWAPPSQHSESLFGRVVKSNSFDVFFSLVVISNAIFIGIDVQLNPTMAMNPRTPIMVAIQYFYTILFCIELGLRAAALGKEYFCSQEWAWAALDVFIVLTSLWEVFVDTWYALVDDGSTSIDNFGGLAGLRAFRIVRITRIVKTVRLMRIFRFVLALRTLVYSILHTLKALFWALVLLFLIIYVFALIFTQAINGHLHDPEAPQLPAAELEVSLTFYGTLIDTMASLFMSVTDGVSWEKIYRPLYLISPLWSFLFLFYVCFVYFAVLNVLTAVFCQSAIESAENDHATAVQNMMANKEMHLKKIRALFSQLGNEESGVITFGQFESKIHSPEVREYFETLGLDVEDAWSFFKLLDRDGGGSVEVAEFLKGCLRFRGQARAIDIGQLLHDQGWLLRAWTAEADLLFNRYVDDLVGSQAAAQAVEIGEAGPAGVTWGYHPSVVATALHEYLPLQQCYWQALQAAHAGAGMTRLLWLLDEAEELREPSSQLMLEAGGFTQAKRPQLAFVALTPRPRPDVASHSSAEQSASKAGSWSLQLELLESLRMQEMVPDMKCCGAALAAVGRSGPWPQAMHLLRYLAARSLESNSVMCTAALRACSTGQSWLLAAQLFHEMQLTNTAPDEVTFGSLACQAQTEPSWARVASLLWHVRMGGLLTNLVLQNTAITAYQRCGQWRRALLLHSSMSSRALLPDAISHNSAISACDEGSKWEPALVMLKSMGPVRPDQFSFTAAGAACGRAAAWAEALVLSDARRYRLQLSSMSCSAAISAAAKQSHWQLPLSLLCATAKPSGAMYRAAVDACDRAGFPQHAQAVLVDSELNGAHSSPTSFCWALARLGVNDPAVIHAALAEAFSAQKQHLPRGLG